MLCLTAVAAPTRSAADDDRIGTGPPVELVRPFEAPPETVVPTRLDAIVAASQARRGLLPARPCSDAVFLRRVFVDMIGTLPEPEETRAFLADAEPDKRVKLVERLFGREEFADYWSLRWCDVLRVKAEFPINLWPNAVQAYHRWIHDAVRHNMPYDQFARALLTSSGSNFRVPPVNFYRALQGRDPTALARVVGLTFMGARVEAWPEARQDEMGVFFSRIAFKRTKEWKEEIVFPDPAPAGEREGVLPDGTRALIGPDDDPRERFADWLITPENPWFARAVVNRIWFWLFGRGVVHEADDLRADNPPVIDGLLEYLSGELIESGWDLRHVMRLVLESHTYQQSPIPNSPNADAATLFACYPVRRLDAEVLIDALCWIGGTGENYQSAIPEPFTFVPEERRTIELADGSITSPFLEMFGRPPRDTGLASERSDAPTDAQCLHLLNSSDVWNRIRRSPRLTRVLRGSRGKPRDLIREIYVLLLSRYPVEQEMKTAEAYIGRDASRAGDSLLDLAWALLNSREFLYRH